MATSKTVSGAVHASGYDDHPGHKISIEEATSRLIVRAGGKVVVETQAALILREASYPPIYYAPRADIAANALTPTDHTTWCPFKGRAAYFSIGADPAFTNAAWSYEDPFEEVAAIAGRVAFYSNKVAIAVIDE